MESRGHRRRTNSDLPEHTYQTYTSCQCCPFLSQRCWTFQFQWPWTTLTVLAGEMLASAGDDGNILLWVPSELHSHTALGEDRSDDKETWRVKHMCRSSGAEIYDLAWSPDGVFLITGSMDNIARIYNAQTGRIPLNPYPSNSRS